MGSSIDSRWRDLSGEKNWAGLLEPLDPDLRCYIIHYGQRVGALTDLFNDKTNEPDASKEEFFSEAHLVKGNPYDYDVTHFLYAGSDDVEPSWFGYVAVATDKGMKALGRRDILVAWRGTKNEWGQNFKFVRRSASDLFPTPAESRGATVHSGFYSLYTGKTSRSRTKTSARNQVRNAVRELVDRYQNEEVSITVTGFSLGAALATLTAMDIVANGFNKPTDKTDKSFMVTAFTYGSPRIGNSKLKRVFDSLGQHLHLLRIENKNDLVPKLPPENLKYTHFGENLIVDASVSNYLERKKPSDKHTRGAIVPLEEDESSRRDTWLLDEGKAEFQPKRKRSIGPEDEPKPKRSRRGKNSFKETVFGDSHNMDMYAHGVAIKDIEKNIPVDELDHDIALVNKRSNRVKKKYRIPEKWWAGENREKMDQLENGCWRVKEK